MHAPMSRQAQVDPKTASASRPPGRLLQRKCDCGTHMQAGGSCQRCGAEKNVLQRKLTLGATNDPLEHEADRIADQLMSSSPAAAASPARLDIQRIPTGSSGIDRSDAPLSVEHALASGGAALDEGIRSDMEARFGHDFSQVRVHRDDAAADSARDVNARAYTAGRDIVFAAGSYAPHTHEGKRLLAHELTHVVQQSGGSRSASTTRLQRAPGKGKAGGGKGGGKKSAPPKPPQICGRNSRKVADNWITKVNLDVGANTLTIEWDDPTKAPAGSAGTHAISPGAGKCCVNCDDDKTSQTSGSLCTPKGDTWKVAGTGCVLSGHPTAKNPTYFQRGGIAIHSGNTASPPKSHGCSRTSIAISELIHDNVVKGKTDISSSGTWAGTTCYKTEAAKSPVARSSVCDGFKLKPPPPKAPSKGKGKDAGKAKKAEADPQGQPDQALALDSRDEQGEAQTSVSPGESEATADGPGPNNTPAAEGDLPPAGAEESRVAADDSSAPEAEAA